MTETSESQDGGAENVHAGEEAASHLEDVQRVTEAALAYLDLDDLLSELLGRVIEILQVDTAAVLLVEDDGRTLAARAASGLEEEVERGFRLPIGVGFVGRVAETREPVVINDLDDSPIEVVSPLMREKGVRSLLGVPLVVEGRLIGVLHVGSLTQREFHDQDVELLQLVADRVGMAIEHAHFATQHRVAQALQRSMMPKQTPSLPGLSTCARYRPAPGDTDVGGDWYDVIELGFRHVGLVIGDVAGRGLRAATAMGQLRSALRAYALDDPAPAQVVGKLGRFVELHEIPMATLTYAMLNLETLDLEFTRAGHPYPLIVRGDGSTEYLNEGGDPPLGAGRPRYGFERYTLRPNDTLLLYTDGLIERRGERLSEGEAKLAEVASKAPVEIEAKCDSIITRMTADLEVNDDIALLALHTVGMGGALELSFAAMSHELPRARHLLRRWLADQGAGDDDCSAFAIAATEAATNAVEHAYGPGDGTVELRASKVGDAVTVTVSDRGSWRSTRGRNRGRGIRLMREFMDDVEFAKLDEGTMVQLRRRLKGDGAG